MKLAPMPKAMLCAVSGSIIEDPLYCPKTGLLYERSVIYKHLEQSGQCPVTKMDISTMDLMELKASKFARQGGANPIPSLITMFRTEYEASMLQNFELRRRIKINRRELLNTFYERDAAIRIIARLQREKEELNSRADEIRQKLPSSKRVKYSESEQKQKPGISEQVIEELNAKKDQLSKDRKAKKYLSPTNATVEEIQTMKLRDSYPIHKTMHGGILSIDLHPVHKNVVVTGGTDHNIQIFDSKSNFLLDSLSGHTRKVTGVRYINSNTLVSCSTDQTCRLWSASEQGGYEQAYLFREHQQEITGVAAHPTAHHFVSVSMDGSWCFYDSNTASCLDRIYHEGVAKIGGYSCAQFHPDGNILGTGTQDRTIHLWDMKTSKSAVKFGGHTGAVQNISFSENGVQLATVAEDSVRIWDLRKLKNTRNLRPFEMSAPRCLEFDGSGQYLVCGGGEMAIYTIKPELQIVKNIKDLPKKGALVVKLGQDSKTLFVGCADHNLRVFEVDQKTKQQEKQKD